MTNSEEWYFNEEGMVGASVDFERERGDIWLGCFTLIPPIVLIYFCFLPRSRIKIFLSNGSQVITSHSTFPFSSHGAMC
jgi:hypothetical protein